LHKYKNHDIITLMLMTSKRTGAGGGKNVPKRDRQRWREKQKKKQREETLDRRTVAGVFDLTPYLAVKRIMSAERGCSSNEAFRKS
jgi:hypothetical protein